MQVLLGKMTKSPFTRKGERTDEPIVPYIQMFVDQSVQLLQVFISASLILPIILVDMRIST